MRIELASCSPPSATGSKARLLDVDTKTTVNLPTTELTVEEERAREA
jgi:hypothetical protein